MKVSSWFLVPALLPLSAALRNGASSEPQAVTEALESFLNGTALTQGGFDEYSHDSTDHVGRVSNHSSFTATHGQLVRRLTSSMAKTVLCNFLRGTAKSDEVGWALLVVCVVLAGMTLFLIWGPWSQFRSEHTVEPPLSPRGSKRRSTRNATRTSLRTRGNDDSEDEEMPDSSEHLQRILNAHGIDTSLWGTRGNKTVDGLFNEINSGQCVLKSIKGSSTEAPQLERHVRLCIAKIRAKTSQGMRHLKYCGMMDEGMGQKHFEDRDCTRKIQQKAPEKPELDRMLMNELKLPSEWQLDHLVMELMEPRPLQEIQGHGESLPGLITRFSFVVAWIRVKDVNAPEVAGKIGLPDGDNFSMLESGKTRFWTWAVPSYEDDQEAASSASGAASPQSRSRGRLSSGTGGSDTRTRAVK